MNWTQFDKEASPHSGQVLPLTQASTAQDQLSQAHIHLHRHLLEPCCIHLNPPSPLRFLDPRLLKMFIHLVPPVLLSLQYRPSRTEVSIGAKPDPSDVGFFCCGLEVVT